MHNIPVPLWLDSHYQSHHEQWQHHHDLYPLEYHAHQEVDLQFRVRFLDEEVGDLGEDQAAEEGEEEVSAVVVSAEEPIVLDLEIGAVVEGFLVGHADGGFLAEVEFDEGHDVDDAGEEHGGDGDQDQGVFGGGCGCEEEGEADEEEEPARDDVEEDVDG